MNEIDKLAWVCIKNNRLLCARSKGKDVFYMPGGKRDADESDQAALIREIKEEISVDLNPATIEHLETFRAQAHDKPEGVLVKITCYQAEFTGELKAATEIEEIRWLSYQEKAHASKVTQGIMDWLQAHDMLF